jgi:hypothetical protein
MQAVPIATNVVSSNPAHGEVYSIQHFVIKFVSDLRQVGVDRLSFLFIIESKDCGVLRHFQQYFSYIVVVSFIGGGNRSIRRKPPTRKQVFFTNQFMSYQDHMMTQTSIAKVLS